MTAPYMDADGLVRVYPAMGSNEPGLVWVHGGGFTGGDLDMPEADAVARGLAARGTTVVSVDYRLAGERTMFPAASDDVLSAWQWTVSASDDLGVDPRRLALGGASAGGNLVAGAVLRQLTGELAAPLPAWVLLAYPTLLAVQPAPDAGLRTALDRHPSADVFAPAAVRRMYEAYVDGPIEDAPLAATPGRATIEDVASYPPVLMITDDIDELRLSGEVFASTLAAARREIITLVEPGTVHGHLNRPDEAAWTHSIELISRCLHLGRPSPSDTRS